MGVIAHGDNDEIVQIADADADIFAAMGLPNATEVGEKAALVYEITRVLHDAKMTQALAARRAGVTPADMSRILRGRTENYSVTRLEGVLTGLGRDVVKVVTPTARASGRGAVSVVYSDTPPLPRAALPRDHD